MTNTLAYYAVNNSCKSFIVLAPDPSSFNYYFMFEKLFSNQKFFGDTTISETTLCIMAFSNAYKTRTQQNDTQVNEANRNDTQTHHNDKHQNDTLQIDT